MSSEETKLQCYNRSCGKLFDPAENAEGSCEHHPGFPVFHDAYKKWSCCDKRTTDFTEFLNIKGCTKSYHSNVKPPEPPKLSKENIQDLPPIPKPLLWKQVIARPDADEEMEKLPAKIGSSLKPILEKMMTEITLENDDVNDDEIQLDTPCYNKGCRAVYKGEQSNTQTCLYHSGTPIFHEGMKYWSCCVKRTTDFDSFLEQVGCTTGKHKWRKDKSLKNKAKCRYDWHQTGNSVIVSVYSKCPLPEFTYIEANRVKLHIHVAFGKEKEVYDDEIVLFGIICVQESFVTYHGSKVEIELRKAENLCWKDLRFRQC